MGVAANIARIREELLQLSDQPVRLVAVSKYSDVAQMREAFYAGCTEFGEARVQDALKKKSALENDADIKNGARWHFIGHLQTNKVKRCVGQFELLHSVDSLHLAESVSAESVKQNVDQSILVQVKILADETKGGYNVESIKNDFAKIIGLPNIVVKGLMTMTPLTDDQQTREFCFRELAKLRTLLTNLYGIPLPELSMGMSDDWRTAIKCGATIIRIGRAIFDI